ncbi:MAG: class E sortase [Ilumatobacteraceae bacterium]
MRRLVTMTAALAIIVGACSSGDSADAPLATAPPATSAGRSTTTTARVTTTTPSTSTTTVPTTTTLPPTTVPPTPPPTPPPTTAPALPVPLAAPPEDGSTDPRIELGTIEIPRLGLTRSMFEGIRLATLNDGPGHWPGTAMPGELGNVVVAGHRVSHNKDFRNLDQLSPGDEVIMSTTSGRHVYHVVRTEIVPPEAIWIVDQTAAHTATLFACHPPGSTRERIVVHLELA